MRKKQLVIVSGVVMVAAFVLGSLFYKSHLAGNISKLGKGHAEPFVQDYSPVYGDPAAKVTLVEFLDPACETCAAFHPHVKKLVDQSEGKVKLVIRYAPFHQGADETVKIVEAARKQGKYWDTLNLLFMSQQAWTHHHVVRPDVVLELLGKTSLDMERLGREKDAPEITDMIRQDLADAETLGVTKTPGFFVNGKPLERFGFRPLMALLDSEIAKAY